MTVEELWDLLPAELRARDLEADGLLRAVVEVLAAGGDVLDDDLDALWDDWFVETCSEWVVPYIGDLVGVQGLHPLTGSAAAFSNRARVADTIRFRRRKGTAAMLEELARSTTGWTARAVEFFELLSTAQHVNHVRLGAPATARIRDQDAMELVDTPFDRTCHTVCVRPLGAYRSGPNVPNVGLYLWEIPSAPVDRATGAAVADPADGRWLVDPLGLDHHLAGAVMTEPEIDHRADEPNTPGLLRRRPLHDELDAQRAAPIDPARLRWFQPDDPAFVVWIQPDAASPLDRVPLELLFVCNLSNWGLPTGSEVRVDPVLGRVAVAAARPVHRLAVSWSTAFSADIGAGPYPRRGDLGGAEGDVDWQIGVSATDPPRPNEVVATLADAVSAWDSWQTANPTTAGRIVVMDSHRYDESLAGSAAIRVGQGSRLSVIAARWPEPEGGGVRDPRAIAPAGVRPCVAGSIEVEGVGTGERPGAFVLDGLLVAGSLKVKTPGGADGIGPVELRHCTLRPDGGGIIVEAGNSRARVTVWKSISGPLQVTGEIDGLAVTDSIVHDPAGTSGLTAPLASADLAGVTVLGATAVRALTATDSLFDGPVAVTRTQEGCVRFSYVPPGSVTPRRYRCQPDLAVAASPADPDVAARLVPSFVASDLAAPGYARLAERTAVELRTGAESGAELGSFRSVLTPQRLGNLLGALEEYLPFGRVAAPLPVVTDQGDAP